jgi:hypothetical protein
MIYADTYPARRSHRGGVFILIILAAIGIIAAINVYLRSHAYDKHGDEAIQARNCIKNNGVWKVYQEPKPHDNIYHWLCMEPQTGVIFDMIVEKVNELAYKEKSAFKPKYGRWESIRNWLEMGNNRGGKWLYPPESPINLIGP